MVEPIENDNVISHSELAPVYSAATAGTGPVAILLVSKVQEQTGAFYWLYMPLAFGALIAALAALLLPGEVDRRPVPAE